MANNTILKEISTKLETVMTILDQKEEKEKEKNERLALLEQSVASIAKCLEAMQMQHSVAPAPQTYQAPQSSLPVGESMEQSFASMATCMEALQRQQARASSSMTLQRGEDQSVLAEARRQHHSPWRSAKMDLNSFDGSNALQWIFQAEKFFDYYDLSDAYRLKVAAIHFDGPVVPWFHMLQKSGIITSWKALAKEIENTYTPSAFACPHFALFKLYQEGTVTEYYQSFATLANQVEGVTTDALLDCSLSGLRKKLQRDVISLSIRWVWNIPWLMASPDAQFQQIISDIQQGFGMIAAMANGFSMPLMTFIFGVSGFESGEDVNGDDDLSNDCSLGGGDKKRKLNVEQVKTLELNFEMGTKLEPERKMQLARALVLQPRQVANWFQNRRARWKTKQLEKDFDALKRQFDDIKSENEALQAQNKKLRAEIMVMKGIEVPETINLYKENEGSCSNRSKNTSEIQLDISYRPAATVAQLLQNSNMPAVLHWPKINNENGVPDESFSNMFCGIEDQSSFWAWLLINTFGVVNKANVVHLVSKVIIKFVYLAIGSGVASFLQVLCWLITRERHAARIRGLYLKTILSQDIEILDNETPIEGLKEWLEDLYTASIPCAVVPCLDQRNMLDSLQRMGLPKYFQVIVTEEDGMESIAHRFLSAALKLDRKPSNVWHLRMTQEALLLHKVLSYLQNSLSAPG